jgi:hypothetical protein
LGRPRRPCRDAGRSRSGRSRVHPVKDGDTSTVPSDYWQYSLRAPDLVGVEAGFNARATTNGVIAVAHAVTACWRRGDIQGLEFEGVSFEEAHALARPAMTIVRGQLRARLAGRVQRAYWRWLHPTSGHRPGDTFL